MRSVKYRPWIGKSYQIGFNGLRTLILGESLYGYSEGDKDPSYSINDEWIEKRLAGEPYATWTKLETALIGRKLTLEEKNQFWNSVAFYNYVQESAGSGPRVCPAEQSWKMSEAPFQELLDELKPEFIVALGYRLGEMLPDLDGQAGPKINSAPPQAYTWIYHLHSGGSAFLFNIMHPSSGFSPTEWHKHILVAFEKAKELHKKPTMDNR